MKRKGWRVAIEFAVLVMAMTLLALYADKQWLPTWSFLIGQ